MYPDALTCEKSRNEEKSGIGGENNAHLAMERQEPSIGTVGMWGRQRQGGTCAEKKNFGKNKMGGQTMRLSGTFEGAPPI